MESVSTVIRHFKNLTAFLVRPIKKRVILTVSLSLGIGLIISGFRNIHGEVVCFGDSITYGADVDGQSWVWYLSKQHADATFINAGRSGRKTTDRQELLPVLKQHDRADYYLIFLGVNDLKDGNDSMVNRCVENIHWMVDEIRKVNKDAQIILLAPTDINLKTMSTINVQKKYNQNTKLALYRLEEAYKQLAGQMHIGFISLLHAVSKANYADGLHPDQKGQEQIAALVWKRLNRLF
jgi:lysophospholipase L1-like esterase